MRALSSFEELKGVCDVSFVLPEQYRVDSAMIVRNYRLHELGSSVSFSDDLFREYSYKGASSATIESNYKTAQYCINLMNLDEQLAEAPVAETKAEEAAPEAPAADTAEETKAAE